MLKIVSTKQLVASMELAEETCTEDQLIHQLLYLNTWHGKDTTVVELHSDIPSSPGLIAWYAHRINGETHKPEADAFYNGGIVFHRNSNEWSIHS